jgi:hypothetical protein
MYGLFVDVCSGFDPKSHSYTNEVEGGAMVVVAGTGAGQYRRVVSWPGSMNGTGGVFEIDSPLTATLDATSVVEIMPMRGKNIFHKTHYADVGAFQFYGLGVDNMVVGMTMERGGGFIAWGQTRADPNHGAFGFVNPNLMNEFVDNTVIEGCKSRPSAAAPDHAAPTVRPTASLHFDLRDGHRVPILCLQCVRSTKARLWARAHGETQYSRVATSSLSQMATQTSTVTLSFVGTMRVRTAVSSSAGQPTCWSSGTRSAVLPNSRYQAKVTTTSRRKHAAGEYI